MKRVDYLASTLAHSQPPVYSRVHAPSLRVALHPGTVGLRREVLPGGTKSGVIWLPYCKSVCGATPDSAFSRGNDMLLLLARRIRFQQIDDWCNARPILDRFG
jgi:hypothetical protein